MLLFYSLLLFFAVALDEDSVEKKERDKSLKALMTKTNSYLVNTEIYSDYLYCAKSRERGGSFGYEKCNSYPDAGFLPRCVYMYSEPNKTNKYGRTVYGCVYAHTLPQKCIDQPACFVEGIDITFRDETVHGVAYICSDNYCNRLEEPLTVTTRLKKRSLLGTDDALQVIIAVLVAVTTIVPFLEGRFQKRHWKRMRVVEEPVTIDKRTGSVFPFVQEVYDVHEQPMKFASFKAMSHVAKEAVMIYRHGGSTLTKTSGSGSGSGNTPTKTGAPKTFEERCAELVARYPLPENLAIHPLCKVFQRSLDHPSSIIRGIPTKFEYLAQKLIEHGPYHYNFDAVELGEMFDSVIPILEAEPSVLELKENIYIYGNVEGSYGDLFRWFHKNGWPPKTRVLFLGGLTNEKSPFSLETIALIFAMKSLMPEHVYIIRGAAETVPLKMDHRFPRRITRALQNVIMHTCGYLPLAAIIGSAFCSHGGFPQSTDELRQIRMLRRPIYTIPEKSIANKLIFSQAGPYEFGTPGTRGSWLSRDTMLDVLVPQYGQTFSLFVRSRNCCRHGYMFIGEQILTLWSAVGTYGRSRAGACMYIDQKMNAHLIKMTQGLFTRKELKQRAADLKRRAQEKKMEKKKKKKETIEVKKEENKRLKRDMITRLKVVRKMKKKNRKKGPKSNPFSRSKPSTTSTTPATESVTEAPNTTV